MTPLEFQRRIARQRLGLEVDEIDGGHMVALSNATRTGVSQSFTHEMDAERWLNVSQVDSLSGPRVPGLGHSRIRAGASLCFG